MAKFVTRSEWGARSPSGGGNALASKPKGHAIHWEGTKMGTFPHSECDNKLRSIQNYHMDTQGWADIAYNLIACPHGYVYEGRGKGKGSAANGTSDANTNYYAICALVGEGDSQPPELTTALKDAAKMTRDWGAGNSSKGHRDFIATSCPGDKLYSAVKAGTFTSGGSSGGGSTPSPTPTPPTTSAPKFPLPSGHYFGPKDGPASSHSGYYSDTDKANLKKWQQRMKDRGWSLAADGLYGPETAGVAKSFQAEKGLAVDGLIGVNTWNAAWTAPVT